MRRRLANYFEASFPAVAIQTAEEQRAVADIFAAAEDAGKGVVTWSATEGVKVVSPSPRDVSDTQELTPACMQRFTKSVYIMRDVNAWPFDRDPIMARALRDLMAWAPTEGSCIVIVGTEFKPYPSIEKMVTVLDYSLPKEEDLREIAKGIAGSAEMEFNGGQDVIRAMSGLTTTEAENALALSLVETVEYGEDGEVTRAGTFDPAIVYREKVLGVKRSGLLEIIDPDPRGVDAIGGLGVLKRWLVKRRRAFTEAARKFGLVAPKGILLVGVPGTGKSLTAKAVGTILGEPELGLDLGAMFGSFVGESEARMRAALQLAEAIAPCVVWIDEIDKGLAGSSGSGSTDSGVTKRVFGTLITWMQERKAPVFIVATANDISNLPPEFVRRWDKVFAIDLPNATERKEIFDIHLAKRNRPAGLATPSVVDASKDYTGSEIERVIDEALYNAFDENRDITTDDLLTAIKQITPLIVTAKEQVESVRTWAQTRADFASDPEVVRPIPRKLKR
jgi:hypothetical protein